MPSQPQYIYIHLAVFFSQDNLGKPAPEK